MCINTWYNNVSTRIDSFWGDMARSTTNTGSLLFATLCAVLLL